MKISLPRHLLQKSFLPLYCFLFIISGQAFASNTATKEFKSFLGALEARCATYGWKDISPQEIPWEYYRITPLKRPLMFVSFGDSQRDCTLFLGDVHGDELPTVYLLLKLANYIKDNPLVFKDKCIVIAPLINPDGFFAKPPQRVNSNGIDINRNFPTKDWWHAALNLWEKNSKKNKRYFPGQKPGSEQETLFQIALIKRFKPQKILSIHSPLGFYDFDGPSSDLDSFEQWLDAISRETNYPLKKIGYYPGSLGNYAGHERNIFTLTLELPSSEPDKGAAFFNKFHPALLKFLNLSITDKSLIANQP
jgi:protein MpaA